MYQAGEVDYLVATDAIGMGLNMHVDHVAFAATRKFDGRCPRLLTPAELAQIAGRAGRFTKNGTFGTTAEIGALDPETAERIESHRFDALEAIYWRSDRLVFTSIDALRRSLARLPARRGLVRAREADDELALNHLASRSRHRRPRADSRSGSGCSGTFAKFPISARSRARATPACSPRSIVSSPGGKWPDAASE